MDAGAYFDPFDLYLLSCVYWVQGIELHGYTNCTLNRHSSSGSRHAFPPRDFDMQHRLLPLRFWCERQLSHGSWLTKPHVGLLLRPNLVSSLQDNGVTLVERGRRGVPQGCFKQSKELHGVQES